MELSKEDKKLVQNIKKLFLLRDMNSIEEGINLAQQAENPNIFDELIGEVKYQNNSFINDWKGTGKDEYYFSVALLGLINYAPQGSKGQIYRDTFKSIRISGRNNHYEYGITTPEKIYAKYLSNFSNLKSLDLERFDEMIGLNEIYHLKLEAFQISGFFKSNSNDDKVNMEKSGFPETNQKWGFKHLQSLKLDLPSDPKFPKSMVQNLDFLSEIISLKSLEVKAQLPYSSDNGKLTEFSISGLEKLVDLEYLRIAANVKSIVPLSDMKALKYLKIESKLLTNTDGIKSTMLEMATFFNCISLQDIAGISNAINLEYLYFNSSEKLEDLRPLSANRKLKILDINGTSVKTLEGLENAENLIVLGLSETPILNLDAIINLSKIKYIDASTCEKLKSLNGLQNCLNLKEIVLSGCFSLGGLEGLDNCKDLVSIYINNTKIKNLSPLINCSKIFQNNPWNENDEEFKEIKEKFSVISTNINNLHTFTGFYFRIEDDLLSKGGRSNYARDYYSDRNWNDPAISEFSIDNCPNLESIEGIKNAGVQLLKISNCPKIKKVDYLSEFSNLQCCDFSDCIELESVETLANLSKMDRLFLRNCDKVKPKPRFTVMDSIEKLNDYLSKFRKNIPKVEISKEKKDINDKLLALLLSDDYAQINLGLELANSISDYDIFNYLLQGVQIFNNLPVTNSIFLGNNRNKDFRAYALEGLLCIAPKEIEIAQRYRNGIIDLNIQGFHITSLLTISGMENLSSLIIQSTKISVISDMNKLQKLEKLIISNNSDLKDLSGLKELKKLKSIEISNCGITDLNDLADLINLVELKITSCQNLTTTNGMINLPALERIKLDSNLALENIDSLGNMSKLIDISLNDCPGINNIKSLVNLPVLKVLRLNRHNLKSSDDIYQLMKPLTEGLRK